MQHIQAAGNAAAYLNPARKRAQELEARQQFRAFEDSAEGLLLNTLFRAFSQAAQGQSLSRPLTPAAQAFGRGFSAGLALSVLYQAIHNVYQVNKAVAGTQDYQQQQLRRLLDALAPLAAQVEPARELAEFQAGQSGETP